MGRAGSPDSDFKAALTMPGNGWRVSFSPNALQAGPGICFAIQAYRHMQNRSRCVCVCVSRSRCVCVHTRMHAQPASTMGVNCELSVQTGSRVTPLHKHEN